MNPALKNYKCDGQMSIEDWLEDREKVRDLDIKGLCIHRRVRRVEVHTEKDMTMQMDGELFSGNSFIFEMISKGLNFIVPSTVDVNNAPCIAQPPEKKRHTLAVSSLS